MARIKGTDSHGKVHWLREIPRQGGGFDYAWADELHATHMPLAAAEKWVGHINRMNHYRDADERIVATLIKEFSK